MGRISIYIPDSLEERIEQHRGALNLSAIAQQAIEQAIRIEQMKGQDMQEASLERLRLSKQSVRGSEREQGFELGKEWSLEVAEYDALERVASFDFENDVPPGDDAKQMARWALAIAVEGEEQMSWRQACETLEECFGTQSPSQAMMDGFVSAAQSVYAKV